MATIYLWTHSKLKTGHVSLETNEWYLSFHPKSRSPLHIVFSEGVFSNTFDFDFKEYGGKYKKITINGLDKHFNDHIKDSVSKRDSKYTILFNNCSDMVAAALLYAYAKKDKTSIKTDMQVKFKEHFHGLSLHQDSQVDSDIMGKFELLAAYTAGGNANRAIKVFRAVMAALHLRLWTPKEVFELAETISKS